MTNKPPIEQVRDLLDELGADMSHDDWIDFLVEVHAQVAERREAAEQEGE